MSERVCGNCRWYLQMTSTGVSGECRRHPSTRGRMGWSWPSTDSTYWCGEWADKAITPEQEERREQVRRFAVALMVRHGDNLLLHNAWKLAAEMADAEPKGV